jgi:ABC-type lipoprotein release transport system permease subunit
LVNDKNKTPIKFLQAGIYTEYAKTLAYTPIPSLQITHADSNKTTFINIKLNDNYQVNKLHLNISAPKYLKGT